MNFNINTPSGAQYAIPASHVARTSPAELVFDDLDTLAFEDETDVPVQTRELQAALATASLFINVLERQNSPDRALPPSVVAAVAKAVDTGARSCSLVEFAASVVPTALRAQYQALQDARHEAMTLEWQKFARDYFGSGAKMAPQLNGSWIDSTARMLVAYGALRETHGMDKIAGAVAETLFELVSAGGAGLI